MCLAIIDTVASTSGLGSPVHVVPLNQWSLRGAETFPELTFTLCSTTLPNCPRCLVCSQRTLHYHPPAGLVSRVQIIVSQSGEYEFQVLLKLKERGTVACEIEFLNLCSTVSKSSSYKFCPGMSKSVYQDRYASVIRYDSKSVRLTSEPFERVDSPHCEMWHKLAKNSSIFERELDEVLCQPCKKMRSHLDQRVRAAIVSPGRTAAWLEASSKCPLAVLSPASQKKRRGNLLKERSQYQKKCEHMELTLDEEQSNEMTNIVHIINRDASDTLNKVITEAETHGNTIREIWKDDVKSSQDRFKKDQDINGRPWSSLFCPCFHIHIFF